MNETTISLRDRGPSLYYTNLFSILLLFCKFGVLLKQTKFLKKYYLVSASLLSMQKLETSRVTLENCILNILQK